MKHFTYMLITFFLIFSTGCETMGKWWDDVYDSDKRMTEIKRDADNLKDRLEAIGKEMFASTKNQLRSRLAIIREEAEMLGALKKAEFELKYQDLKGELADIGRTLDSQ